MCKQILYLILFAGMMTTINCNSRQLSNQWKQQTISIDGKAADWEGSDLQFFDDLNLAMATTNDSANLYIMLQTTEFELSQRIRRMGMTIWLDNSGKKNKIYGVRYTGSMNLVNEPGPPIDRPMGESMDDSDAEFPADERDRRDQRDQRDRRRPPDKFRPDLPAPGNIMLIQDKEKVNLPENNSEGPEAGSAVQNGFFCYEFRFPLTDDLKLGAAISLGLELGGIKAEDLKKMRRPPDMGDEGSMGDRDRTGRQGGMYGGGGMDGGPGGQRGMRRPGGMGNRGPRPDQEQMEPKEIWMKMILAEK